MPASTPMLSIARPTGETVGEIGCRFPASEDDDGLARGQGGFGCQVGDIGFEGVRLFDEAGADHQAVEDLFPRRAVVDPQPPTLRVLRNPADGGVQPDVRGEPVGRDEI